MTTTAIQIKVQTYVPNMYIRQVEWIIVNFNQKTATKVTAKGLGGYGSVR